MRTIATTAVLLALAAGQTASAQKHRGGVDIDGIMASLTLEQKLGQITLIPIGEPFNIPSGQKIGIIDEWKRDARSGAVGCMYGPNTAAYTNSIQKAAFEESEHGSISENEEEYYEDPNSPSVFFKKYHEDINREAQLFKRAKEAKLKAVN